MRDNKMTTMLRYAVRSSSKPLWRRCCVDNNTTLLSRCLSSSSDTSPKGIPYNKLTVGIPKEDFPLEKRVAATPESVERLVQPGFNVVVESDAGKNAYFSNADYESSGATIVSQDDVWKKSDIILKVRATRTTHGCVHDVCIRMYKHSYTCCI